MLSTFETWNLNHFFFLNHFQKRGATRCSITSVNHFRKQLLKFNFGIFFLDITFITFVLCVVSMCFNVMMMIVFENVAVFDSLSWCFCEGCLVVGCDHGPQAEVAQRVGPGPLVEH